LAKLFSIKQTYSDRIFRNEKLVEFRRQNVNVSENEACLIYTSSPIKKITGFFVVKEKIRASVSALWKRTKMMAGITKAEFVKYFEGCKEGTAIVFKLVKRFPEGIRLREIRLRIRRFRPPQSYYGVDREFIARLRDVFPNRGIRSLSRYPI